MRSCVASERSGLRNMQTANILMCANAEYAQHLAVALVSLLENNDWGYFNIVVVGSKGLVDESEKIRNSLGKYKHFEIEFRIRVDDEDTVLPLNKHYSVDNYSRIWVEKYFPENTARVLYLDSDLIVVGSIMKLYNYDIGDNVVGAVSIAGSDRSSLLEVPVEFGYFNSGVILIDLEKWRNEDVFSRLITYIRGNADKLIDADQDALNACLYDQRCPLDYVWNVISPYYWDEWQSELSTEDLRRIRRNARIVHFNGASKPWSFHNRHPRKTDYYKYLSLTEWKDFVPTDQTPLDRLKYAAASTLPLPIVRMLQRLF